ncbi:hypothetical protein JCGZ_14906 [Jatropha curcas]|uniref:Uncharacterized protein n=1 Tax=Jatropha curcas TaxID=180498 RepID=A0A067LNF0_JATCU|nr:hypothetical protein JCGZ_14906 [Jatropha curcas]
MDGMVIRGAKDEVIWLIRVGVAEKTKRRLKMSLPDRKEITASPVIVVLAINGNGEVVAAVRRWQCWSDQQ